MYLSQSPGLESLGKTWKLFFSTYLDKCDPSGMFTESGWSGKGMDASDNQSMQLVAGGTNLTAAQGKKDDADRIEMMKRPAAMKRPACGDA